MAWADNRKPPLNRRVLSNRTNSLYNCYGVYRGRKWLPLIWKMGKEGLYYNFFKLKPLSCDGLFKMTTVLTKILMMFREYVCNISNLNCDLSKWRICVALLPSCHYDQSWLAPWNLHHCFYFTLVVKKEALQTELRIRKFNLPWNWGLKIFNHTNF